MRAESKRREIYHLEPTVRRQPKGRQIYQRRLPLIGAELDDVNPERARLAHGPRPRTKFQGLTAAAAAATATSTATSAAATAAIATHSTAAAAVTGHLDKTRIDLLLRFGEDGDEITSLPQQ